MSEQQPAEEIAAQLWDQYWPNRTEFVIAIAAALRSERDRSSADTQRLELEIKMLLSELDVWHGGRSKNPARNHRRDA